MKEEEIKNTIKVSVKTAWEELDAFSAVFGVKNDLTNRQRTVWSTLDDLWNKLYPGEEY